MCQCTPEVKTPFCGGPGCEWPAQSKPGPGCDECRMAEVPGTMPCGRHNYPYDPDCLACGLTWTYSRRRCHRHGGPSPVPAWPASRERIVQLVPWRDELLALTDYGRVYSMKLNNAARLQTFLYFHGFPPEPEPRT